MKEKDKPATKKDLLGLLRKLELFISKETRKMKELITGFYNSINEKLDHILEKTDHISDKSLENQKYILQKIKDHEKRLRDLETENWQN